MNSELNKILADIFKMIGKKISKEDGEFLTNKIEDINSKISNKLFIDRIMIKDLMLLGLVDIKLKMMDLEDIEIKTNLIDDFVFYFNFYFILLCMIDGKNFNENVFKYLEIILEENEKDFSKNMEIEDEKIKNNLRKILGISLGYKLVEKFALDNILRIELNKNKLLGLKKAFEMSYLDIIYQNDLAYKMSKNICINSHPFYSIYKNHYYYNDFFHLLLFTIFFHSEKYFLKDLVLFVYFFELLNLKKKNLTFFFLFFIIDLFVKKKVLPISFNYLQNYLFTKINLASSEFFLNIIGQYLILKFSSIVSENQNPVLKICEMNYNIRSLIFENIEIFNEDEILNIEFPQ